eukprot:GCRY01003025.1.p1 GENE.GCRY01003025.1~~GCRY01003025.1.p1  ORF type:complete len:184 (+),score=19.67 GCRY01003025.1:383-934(+)
MSRVLTTKDILKLKKPTTEFLIPIDASWGIFFHAFRIRDLETKETYFEFSLPEDKELPFTKMAEHYYVDDSARTIDYTFPKRFLEAKDVGTCLTFSTGEKPITNFRMIERHYFREKLIKSYDFNFDFCIPCSTNSWEVIYSMPKLSKSLRQDMIANPGETKADSFYFIEDKLIMHHKASFSFE